MGTRYGHAGVPLVCNRWCLMEVAKVALCSPRLWDAALEAARRWIAFEPQSLNPRCAEAFAQAGSQVQLRLVTFRWTLMCFDVLCKCT